MRFFVFKHFQSVTSVIVLLIWIYIYIVLYVFICILFFVFLELYVTEFRDHEPRHQTSCRCQSFVATDPVTRRVVGDGVSRPLTPSRILEYARLFLCFCRHHMVVSLLFLTSTPCCELVWSLGRLTGPVTRRVVGHGVQHLYQFCCYSIIQEWFESASPYHTYHTYSFDWICLGSIGLDRFGLDWIRLFRLGLDWMGFGLYWIGLEWIWFVWIWNILVRAGLELGSLDWIGLVWTASYLPGLVFIGYV